MGMESLQNPIYGHAGYKIDFHKMLWFIIMILRNQNTHF